MGRRAIKRKGPPVTKPRMIKAIEGSWGIKGHIAERLGVSRNHVDEVLARPHWKEIRQIYNDECERVGDIAEDTLKDAMSQRLNINVAVQTAQWLLNRKYSKRGYIEKKHLTLEGGDKPIKLEQELVNIDKLDLSIAVRAAILEAMEKKEEGEKPDGDKEE